jgi:hypothetical protein
MPIFWNVIFLTLNIPNAVYIGRDGYKWSRLVTTAET